MDPYPLVDTHSSRTPSKFICQHCASDFHPPARSLPRPAEPYELLQLEAVLSTSQAASAVSAAASRLAAAAPASLAEAVRPARAAQRRSTTPRALLPTPPALVPPSLAGGLAGRRPAGCSTSPANQHRGRMRGPRGSTEKRERCSTKRVVVDKSEVIPGLFPSPSGRERACRRRLWRAGRRPPTTAPRPTHLPSSTWPPDGTSKCPPSRLLERLCPLGPDTGDRPAGGTSRPRGSQDTVPP